MRLIDADAIKAELIDFYRDSDRLCNEIACIIDSVPTIDAVPVVRYKDCVDSKPSWEVDGLWDCKYCTDLKKPDDFCSYGERREGEF